MVHIPLEKRLRKRQHAEIARVQDALLDAAYSVSERLVFHGGTAIWRCYGGNRFSEDLDFYGRKIDLAALRREIERRGLRVLKMKDTGNVVFCKAAGPLAEARLEISSARIPAKPVSASYEKADGGSVVVLTLSPAELVEEKIAAYSSRRLVRDVYDILQLCNVSGSLPQETGKALARFLRDAKPPVDEDNLRSVVYSGVAPSFDQMVEQLRRVAAK